MLLPDGYTQLQYLESSGTQYINTSFTPNTSRDKLVFDVEYVGAIDYFAGTQSGTIYYGVRQGGSADTMAWHCLNSGSAITFDCHFVGDRHTFTYDHNALYVDSTLKALGNYQGSVGVALYLFARNNANTAANFCSCKIYSAEFYRDGELIHSYIPAKRNSDGVLGLYDTVARVFRTNSGSGTFIAGPLAIISDEKELLVPQYDIEIWDWKTNTYVADISNIVTDGINFSWVLNDVETIDFNIDLVQFEKKCVSMGVTPEQVLTPYIHDIRIRRNGNYIIGAQVVETNIQISDQQPPVIQIKCTGFLNLFKDQYITNSWGGYTYAQVARKLVEGAQTSDSLLYNSTIDIDAAYWLAANGTISYSTSSPHSGTGCLAGTRSGTGWITYGTQMSVQAGQKVKIDLWVKGQSGITSYIRERQLVTQSSNQSAIHQFTTNGSWQHIVINSYETVFEDGYLVIEHSRTDSSTPLCVDDVYVYLTNDDASLCNMNVRLGIDSASPTQESNRVRSYSLQNVKDAIMELTSLENDNFDFDFSPDRTFNVYAHKGREKSDLELVYPGNIQSMDITRSASNMANKIINIGSGIGDQRLQVVQSNTTSRQIYGTRESVLTNNNVNMKQTLRTEAIGELWDRKDPTDLPSIVVRDGSINPSNLQIGDSVLVQVRGDNYLSTVNGMYRVVQMDVSTTLENVETVTLTLEPPLVRPTPKTIRYIKDSLYGSTANNSNHWVEIEALMLVGNEYFNVAYGKTVTCSASGEGQNIQRITDGDLNTNNYFGAARRSSVTIDLGAEYPIDYIKVWHYYGDGRTYYGNVLSVGKTNKSGTTALDTVLWSYNDSSGYVETADGRQSRWLQEDV